VVTSPQVGEGAAGTCSPEGHAAGARAQPPAVSPEARRRAALRWRAGLQDALEQRVGPGSRAFIVIRRVTIGVWHDGFIHAGNLAYMGILALFPFFITVGAVFSALGEGSERAASVDAFLTALPRIVARSLAPVAHDVITARHGWLLWAGGIIGLWTVSSLIETIRDILHRAYGVAPTSALWRYRLFSITMIVAAVVLLLASLYAQVAITAAQELIAIRFPHAAYLSHGLSLSRAIPAAVLFGSIYLLFFALTPTPYRRRPYPKWPGALLVTLWWGLVSIILPLLLRFIFKYDLTYGSLAGVMISLFFFWLVGLGIVTGAELNAALAETPEERDMLGQADDRDRASYAARYQETTREDNE
jgi:membrane protein